MKLIKKILSSSLWLFTGNSIGRLAMFLTNILAARILSQEAFGQFTMIRSTISSIEGILSGTLGSPMIKRVSEISQKDQHKLNNIISALFFINIIIALILATILYFSASLIVKYFFIGQNELVHGLTIGTFLLLTTTLSNSMQAIFTGLEEFKKLAFAGIGASIVSFPIIAILIYFFGLYGAIWGVVLYFFSDFGWKYFQLRKTISLSFITGMAQMGNEGKRLLRFSTPLFLSVIVTSTSFWYARVMVIESTEGFSSIAIFDAAYQWLTIIMIITGATTSVALPMFSKAFSKNDKSKISQVFWMNFSVNLGISLAMAILLALLSKQIMGLYGKTYISGYKILMILSFTSVFFTISSVFNRYHIANNKSSIILFATLLGSSSLFLTLNLNAYHNAYALSISLIAYYCSMLVVFTSSILYTYIKNGLK